MNTRKVLAKILLPPSFIHYDFFQFYIPVSSIRAHVLRISI